MRLALSIWSFYCCLVGLGFSPFIGILFRIYFDFLFTAKEEERFTVYTRGPCTPVCEFACGSCALCSNVEGGSSVGPFGQIKWGTTSRFLLCVSPDAAHLHFNWFYCDFSTIRLTDSVPMSGRVILNSVLLSFSTYCSQPRDQGATTPDSSLLASA